MTNTIQSEGRDIRYEATPEYLYPLAEKLSEIDRNWPIAALYGGLIDLIKYLIKYHDMDNAADFYEALRMSTFEQNIYGTYFKKYRRVLRSVLYGRMVRRRVLMDRRILEQIPQMIIEYLCENNLSDRVIDENK